MNFLFRLDEQLNFLALTFIFFGLNAVTVEVNSCHLKYTPAQTLPPNKYNQYGWPLFNLRLIVEFALKLRVNCFKLMIFRREHRTGKPMTEAIVFALNNKLQTMTKYIR